MKDPIAQLAQHFTEQQLLTAIIVVIISIIVTMIILRFNRQTVLGKLVDPMIGQTVVHFVTHGCMGTEHEFNYIGIIVDSEPTEDNIYIKGHGIGVYYKVRALKDQGGESRNKDGCKREFYSVPSWYIQNLGGMYVAYD